MNEALPLPAIPLGFELGAKYRVTRFLGAGAVGAVYEVADQQGNCFAAKVFVHLAPATRGDGMKRFLREVEVSRAIRHPNVVRVVDSARCPNLGVPFIVMERVHGPSLEDLVDSLGALHPTVASRLILQACRGIEEAHANGIVHRDIKPSNLLLDVGQDDAVRVKVCDFGAAKWTFASGDITRTGAALGTPLYMAPEQALDPRKADERADIWSVAMTLYHALTGTTAFERVGGLAALLVALTERQVRNVQDLAPWIEPQLASVLHGALVRDPAQRCSVIGDFMSALGAASGGCDAISRDQLVPVAQTLRAHVALRAALPERWTDSFVKTLPISGALPEPVREDDELIGRVVGTGLNGSLGAVGWLWCTPPRGATEVGLRSS
ncbi:MAG: serine/threonine-protein kinase [Myxococcota bacterium]